MRNIISGIMVFVLGLGVGTGVGLSFRGWQTAETLQTKAHTEPSSTDLIRPISLPEQQNPLAVRSDDSTLISETESLNEEWLDFAQDAEARMFDIEQRLDSLELSDEPEPQPDVSPASRNTLNQSSLQQAGFDEVEVAEIASFYNQQQLQRLELRDKAIREGWIDSDEYRTAIRELRGQSELRSSLGENRYDQFLLAQGRSNRVRIDEVMSGSSAQSSGVLPGDVISQYAETRVYSVRDLQAATTAGERDELVNLVLVRSGEAMQLIVPRGPLGVTVSGVQVEVESE